MRAIHQGGAPQCPALEPAVAFAFIVRTWAFSDKFTCADPRRRVYFILGAAVYLPICIKQSRINAL
jgi:hypothetical protein